MRYLQLLLLFSFEVAGIAVVGYLVNQHWHLSEVWLGVGVTTLIIGSFIKFLWLLSRWKQD